MKLIDSHAHLMDEMYDDDLNEVIDRCVEKNLEMIVNIGYNEETSRKAVKLAGKYDWMYATVGMHPDECNGEDIDLSFVEELAEDRNVVAIGEIGLDYHYDTTNKVNQMKWFVEQIRMANRLKLPVAIHSRDADMDMLKVLKENKIENGFVMHCFSSSVEVAKEIIKLGGYISLAGTVTFKNARNLVEVAKLVPDDRLMVETDSPYLTPEPFRGKRNEPWRVWQTAERVAEIRGVTVEELADLTIRNTKEFYKILGK